MKNKKGIALLAIASYYICGGFDFIIIDQITGKIPSVLMITFRLIICGVVLAIFALVKRFKYNFSKREWIRVIICGIIGFPCYYIAEAIGISMTSGSMASLILATIPFFGIVSGAIFFKEKITVKSIICIIISIAGVILVVVGNGQASFAATITGVLVMVLASIIWVMYIVAVKPVMEDKSALEMTTLFFIIGGIVSIPIFCFSKPELLSALSVGEVGLTAFSAIFILALGQLFYIYGVDKVSVTEVSLYANLVPIITVVFSFIFFREALSIMQIVGGIVILASVTLASKE